MKTFIHSKTQQNTIVGFAVATIVVSFFPVISVFGQSVTFAQGVDGILTLVALVLIAVGVFLRDSIKKDSLSLADTIFAILAAGVIARTLYIGYYIFKASREIPEKTSQASAMYGDMIKAFANALFEIHYINYILVLVLSILTFLCIIRFKKCHEVFENTKSKIDKKTKGETDTSDIKEKTEEIIEDTKEIAKKTKDEAKEKTKEIAEKTEEKIEEVAKTIKEGAEKLTDKTKEKTEEIENKAKEITKDNEK